MLAIVATKALNHTITDMKKSKLQQLLSQVDELDSLAYEKLYELHESRSSWFDPAERSQPILYNHEDYPTSRVIAWNSETVLDWCFHLL